jgi:hypothetical protein
MFFSISGFQARSVAGFGQRGNGKIDGRGVLAESEPRRSHAYFVYDDPLDRGQRLRYTPDAGAAVHSIDSQLEFRHCLLLF